MHKKCPVVAYVFVNFKKKGKRRNNCFFSSIRHEIFCLTKSWQLSALDFTRGAILKCELV